MAKITGPRDLGGKCICPDPVRIPIAISADDTRTPVGTRVRKMPRRVSVLVREMRQEM